jgi:S-adenosylmethionine-diacylglycerol 3-amino-3-carboxypropyl transferase
VEPRVRSEAAARADFSTIRYAQVWEDADVLLAALAPRPGDVHLSIASAGDNVLALLTTRPAKVLAVDLNPAQLACLALRIAAYRTLTHAELLELIGSRPSARRLELYERCRKALTPADASFWDGRRAEVELGVGSIGRFERYFALFRTRVLPLVHRRRTVDALLQRRSADERRRFYDERWDTMRWRLLFRIFFSRTVMGRLGRDPEFFRYVEADVAGSILRRTAHALRELDPSANPYVHWILTGTHGDALPLALRPEHFDTIRDHVDRVEPHLLSIEELLGHTGSGAIDRCNLSDLFEYVSEDHYHRMLEGLVRASRPGGRLAYWNMLAPRRRPESMAAQLRPLDDLAGTLHLQDKAFFYSALRIEEVV